VIADEGRPVQVACRILGVSESGFYEQRDRAPSERAVRQAMLTDLITQIHTESYRTYGARRVYAELTLGRRVEVGLNQVELVMRRAGLQGVSGRRKWKRMAAASEVPRVLNNHERIARALDRADDPVGDAAEDELESLGVSVPINVGAFEDDLARAIAGFVKVVRKDLGPSGPRRALVPA
jgi:hypothetical protein